VGPITALTFRAVLDDIGRFPDARSVAAYLGLVPREDSSGERHRKGAITKAGPNGLRTLLVQASWVVWRQRKSGGALHAWVERLASRRGKRIAVVALARRLGRMLYAIRRCGEHGPCPDASSVVTEMVPHTPLLIMRRPASTGHQSANRRLT
jgi:transposase